ncbi:MAG: MmcQ/YjbR family DNA-binding protein [Maricaulaceae bacterium]|jgi:hypothetical protein
MRAAFAPVREVAERAGWPGVEEGLWYGTPSLKVKGKGFCRLKDIDTLVVLCPLEDKEMLLEAEPELFYETDHYKGWPVHLVRLAKIAPVHLRARLDIAYRMKAPRTLLKEYEARSGD